MPGSKVITVIGAGLIVIGVLFLLQSLGFLAGVLPLAWVLLFLAAGGVFLYVFSIDRERWWVLIPGFSLLGLGALIGLAEYGPEGLSEVAAGVFVGSIGLSFLAIYLIKRQEWWPIIPAGVLLSVAAMIAAGSFLGEPDWIVAILFLGITLTFAVLALLPLPQGRMTWAFIPAAVFFLVGLIILGTATDSMIYILPGAIILIGLYILLRALFKR